MKKKIYSKKELSELVDGKGGKITGGKKQNQTSNASSSNMTSDGWDELDPETGEVKRTHQGSVSSKTQELPPFQFYARYYGESKEPKTIQEVAKDKMKNVLEDIISKKKFDADVLSRVKNLDSGIPEVETIKEENPVLVRKISHIRDLINREEISGEEKAILLNHVLDVDLTDIPPQYKRELVRKLGY